MDGRQQAPGPCVVAGVRGFQGEPEAQISQVSFRGFSPVSLCAPRPALGELPAPWGRLALGSWRNKQVPYVGCLEVGQLGSGSFRQEREGGTLDAAPAALASPSTLPPASWSLFPFPKLCSQRAPEIVSCTSHMPTSAPHSRVALSLSCCVTCFIFGRLGQMLVSSPNLPPLASTHWL